MNLFDKKILVITGKAGAGKDTLANMVREFIYGTRPNNSLRDFKFAAPLKDAFCKIFGWQRSLIDNMAYKQVTLAQPFVTQWDEMLWTRREIMQYLGTDVFRKGDPDIWIRAALDKATNEIPFVDGFISTDCRFPNELDALRKNFNAVHTLHLVKAGGEQLDGGMASHASEQGPYGDAPFQGHVVEAGDLEGLRRLSRNLACRVFPELVAEEAYKK